MKTYLSRFPIKWKITIWTSVVLFLLFSFFAIFQYFFLKNWMLNHEKTLIIEKMREVQAYVLAHDELSKETIIQSKQLLENVNEKNELIKIVDQNDNTILTITDDPFLERLSYIPKLNEVTFIKNKTDHYIIYTEDINHHDFHGSVEIIRNLESYTRLFHHLSIMMVLAVLGAILLSSIGGIIIANQILKPIKVLSAIMQKIKAKGLKQRVPEFHTKDEITELTRIFNQMMDDLENSFNKQKQFVEDASHELRTPISILEGHLSMLQRWGKKDAQILDESLKSSLYEVKRLKDLVLNLLDLTRVESTQIKKETFNPNFIIDHVIHSFITLYPDFKFIMDYKKTNVEFHGVQQHFEQLLIIILDNAIKYSQSNKRILVDSEVKNQKLFLYVRDHGEGIPKEELPFVFDRFYRVDKARSRAKGGNGLGLSIAKKIVENFDGTITIESELNKGTTVILGFPIHMK
ncbi:HAMP domain-containing sensor histidine kinase [Bacillus sp. Marseille-P3661]|uniref:HAMP domain-containing sensor histidine kinase n=1 Tax=Bacillus sp. Marseille-P3661 TaxID=1936234 RepID=UPI000C84E922|nr:HAMP domain-containing histidine kinase [Bacillus sp. Marseille-P3661]